MSYFLTPLNLKISTVHSVFKVHHTQYILHSSSVKAHSLHLPPFPPHNPLFAPLPLLISLYLPHVTPPPQKKHTLCQKTSVKNTHHPRVCRKYRTKTTTKNKNSPARSRDLVPSAAPTNNKPSPSACERPFLCLF